MPKVQVQVGVSVSNGKTGKLEIKVKPWRVHVAAGDTLEWVPVALNGGSNVMSWVRIDTVSHTDPWPFPDAPPDPGYTGMRNAGNARTPRGRKAGLAVGDIVPYTIALAFKDSNGNERSATVDPDMIMD
jgi:hypothetical protein